MDISLLAAFPYLDRITNIATVAIGLGLVIFFHELGHFAVAKWCNVMVERFSIGFGPVLWRKKWGETEYALSAIPFGGYVKMLGQDDIDPGQMADEQVAADPRSYTAKSVMQRMAIISAGVTMNIITGILFFAFAFRSGIEVLDREVGFVKVGMPAWEYGIREGDVITSMNDRKVDEFQDILRQTALSRGDIDVVGKHADGTPFHETFSPDRKGIRRRIGTGYQYSLRVPLVSDPEKIPITVPGSPASLAGFKPGDQIVEVDGQPVKDFMALKEVLAAKRKDPVTFTVERVEPGKQDQKFQEKLTVPPEPFRQLGLRMSIGPMTDLRRKGPASTAGLEKNDTITHVDGREVGRDLDPMRLPEYFEEKAGQQVAVTINRAVKGGEPQTREVKITPEKAIAWAGPREEKDSLEIQAIGAAVEVLPNIVQINSDGPAAKLGIQPGDSIVSLEIPADTALAAARVGRSAGATVMVNASPAGLDPAFVADLAGTTDVVIVNDTEAGDWLDGDRARVPHLVITRGADGATHIGEQTFDVPAPAVEPVDTTGAGDVFAGVLAAAWPDGLEFALRRACAAGALATLIHGAGDCAPYSEAIEDVLNAP